MAAYAANALVDVNPMIEYTKSHWDILVPARHATSPLENVKIFFTLSHRWSIRFPMAILRAAEK